MKNLTIRWNLRQLMAAQEMFATSDLLPLLAQRGVRLSREQVYRLVTKPPQRLNMDVLAALCDILRCGPSELIEVVAEREHAGKRVGKLAAGAEPVAGVGRLRPVPARVRRPQSD